MEMLRHLVETRGFFSRGEALDSGTTDAELAAGLGARVWTRFRHGYYTAYEWWEGSDPPGRHLLRADSWQHQMRGAVAFSHVTGSLVHGIDLWGLPLDDVHVTRLDAGAGRRARGIVHHHGVVRPDEVVQVGGRLVLPPTRCALEAASLGDPESALVALDSLRHQGLASEEDLSGQFAAMQHWPGTQKLHIPVRMADAGAESVGESRTRWLIRCAGIEAPVLQYEVYDGTGHLVATCDMAWPDLGVILEFDGRYKYERFAAPGMRAGDVAFAEKQREDRIRELTGFTVVRVTWADLDRPRLLAERIGRALRANPRRHITLRTDGP